jgi:hypothetical protein
VGEVGFHPSAALAYILIFGDFITGSALEMSAFGARHAELMAEKQRAAP